MKLRGFSGNISVLAGGILTQQLVHILFAPVITRLYSPEDMGILAVFVSLSTTAAVFATLRYEMAVMLPREQKDGLNLVSLSLFIALSMSVIIGILTFTFRDRIAGVLGRPDVSSWLMLFPLAVFWLAVQQVFRLWRIREGQFRKTALSSVFQAGVDNLVKAGSALVLYAGSGGLIAGYLAGILTADWILAWRVRFPEKQGVLDRLERMLFLGAKYKAFPVYNSWSTLMNALSIHSPALLLAFLFGPGVAGLYALTHRILKIPSRILGQAVSQSLFKELVEKRTRGLPVFPLVFKTSATLLVLASLPLAGLMLTGEGLFLFVFGSEWGKSGRYAAVMAPWIAAQFVASSVSTVFPALERNRFYAALQLMLAVAVALPILVSFYLGMNDEVTIVSLSIFNTAAYVVYGFAALGACRRHDAAGRQGEPGQVEENGPLPVEVKEGVA
jgi:lipopolysaccharide exporter